MGLPKRSGAVDGGQVSLWALLAHFVAASCTIFWVLTHNTIWMNGESVTVGETEDNNGAQVCRDQLGKRGVKSGSKVNIPLSRAPNLQCEHRDLNRETLNPKP